MKLFTMKMIKPFLLGISALLIATPAMSHHHPKNPRNTWEYSYPEKNVMVRRDWKLCKKIKYVTNYDKYGWYTERKVMPLRSCWKNYTNTDVKLKVIINR